MEDKSIQFLEKLDGLSQEDSLYFSSKIEAEVLKEIQKDYQLSSDDLDNLIYDTFIADFKFDVLEKGLKATKVPAPSQSKLAADILGKLFLPIAPFLKLDIKAEIIKRGHRPEIYEKYTEALTGLIEDKNFESLEEVVKLHESTFNPLEEENTAIDMFSKGLNDLLNDTDTTAVNNLNSALVYLLINKPDFHNKISKILLDNQEEITTQNLSWTEGVQRGTVANWLKDFIRENGSDIYNSVVLSRYLATSVNPQLLSEGERKIVRRLLKLYRNLIFFPDSMNDVSVEEWEIIPVEKVSVERPIVTSKTKVSEEVPAVVVVPKVAEEPKKIVETPISLPVFNTPIIEDVAIPKIEADLEDSKLASLLTKYHPDSLEAKVVKEEIKRRKK
ncbi:MAG: hypothetical protein WCJ57_03100 [Candidatus Falkowbacteria bacterium]